MYQWRNVLVSTAVAVGVGLGTAVTIAIAAAIVGLYLSGHNIEVPDITIDRGPIHLRGADIVLLIATAASAVVAFCVTYRARRWKRSPPKT
jgi:hypothetical protein